MKLLKINISIIEKEIDDFLSGQSGWRLCDGELKNYKDNKTKLKFIHEDGYLTEMSRTHLQRNHKLTIVNKFRPELSLHNLKLYLKLNFKNISISDGEKYNGRKAKIECNCEIHGVFKTTVDIILKDEKKGRKFICPECALENNKGENHYNYNPNLSEEDRKDRSYTPMYRNFISRVYKRDKYKCQCCFKHINNTGNVHHLNGWHWCSEQRMDMDNAITLCKNCHELFHSIFGRGNNTKEQTEYWLKYYQDELIYLASQDYEYEEKETLELMK